MDVKLFVATLPDDVKLAPWCRRLEISRPTAYKWRARYRAEGLAGLEDRSRAPKTPHGRTEDAVEESVLRVRKELLDEGLDAGAASVHYRLGTEGLVPPSESTIYRILLRRGQITLQPSKRPKSAYRRFERARPNECWQGDDTHYVLATGQEVRIINILDDHSRMNVDSLSVANCTSVRVWESFTRGAERLGVPAEFLNDNGRAWISPPRVGPTVFQGHLARLGVRHLHSRPFHPQTCGKAERFHQTQRRWLDARPPAWTIAELQGLLDEFRELYNNRRPHRALARRTPAAVWSAQPPATPAHPALDPAITFGSGQVASNGVVQVGHRYQVGLGAEWAHHHVTLIRRGLELTVITTSTGEIIRELVIDPSRRYQPSGNSRGRRPGRRNV